MLAGDEAAERLRVAYRRAWLAIDDLAVAPDPCGRQGLAGGGVVRTGIVEEWVLKVRKLLAKAASTDSDAESAALRAKALELMERHRISAALVAGEEAGGEVVERTLLLGAGPYVSARFALLDALGRAHGCEVFWQTLAAGRLVHVAGHPTDVELVLAAHTLLANQALASLAAHRPRGNALAWRRAFLTGFAKEVSDRLEATHAGRRAGAYEGDDGRLDDADARSVALVLRARADALQQHMNAHHPRIRSVASRHLTSVSGYAAGREAGSRADLPGAVRLPKGRPALGA